MPNPQQAAQAQAQYSSAKKRVEVHAETGTWKPTAFKVPEGVELFKFEREGKYYLDIIPYRVGKGNPFADEGMLHYERTYYIHKDVGVDTQSYCCLKKTFGKDCPICKHVALKRREGVDKKVLNEMSDKERQLWLIRDRNAIDKGVQLMECSHFGKGQGFGEMLDNKTDAADEDSQIQRFFHLDGGMVVVVKTKKDTYNGKAFYKPVNIEMEPRPKNIPVSILDKVPCLDDLPIEVPYAKLEKIFLMADAKTPAGGEQVPEVEEETEGQVEQNVDEPDPDAPPEVEEEEELPPPPVAKPKPKPAAVAPKPAPKPKPAPVVEEVEEEVVEEAPGFGIGDDVSFDYRGATYTGSITKLFESKLSGKPCAAVKVQDEEKPRAVLVSELRAAEVVEEVPEVEEEVIEEEEEAPPPKVVNKPKPKQQVEMEDEDTDLPPPKPKPAPVTKKPVGK